MPETNSPELWNGTWQRSISLEEDQYTLAKEENSIRYRRIREILSKHSPTTRGLRVIEVGAGAGTVSALLAKEGAEITILDYAQRAIDRSQELFQRHSLPARFLLQDALALPPELLGQFDVAMSFGLTEHFLGDKRIRINQAHFDLLRPGGIALISVPNAWNLPYRFHKLVAEKLGVWKVGEEYPYTRREFRRICESCGIRDYQFIGDSLFDSAHWISPVKYVKRLFRISPSYDSRRLKPQRGSWLDEYFAYALVLCARRGS